MFNIPPEKLPLAIALLTLPIIPNIWAIWHAFKSNFNTPQEKMAWVWMSILLPVLGGIAYFFFGRPRVIKPGK